MPDKQIVERVKREKRRNEEVRNDAGEPAKRTEAIRRENSSTTALKRDQRARKSH